MHKLFYLGSTVRY